MPHHDKERTMGAFAVPLLTAVAGGIITSALVKRPQQQQQPAIAAPVAPPAPIVPEKPAEIPTMDTSQSVLDAHKKAIAQRQAASGRVSTILSNSNTDYNDKLGA